METNAISNDNIEINIFLLEIKRIIERRQIEERENAIKLSVYNDKCPSQFSDTGSYLINELNMTRGNYNSLKNTVMELLYKFCPHEWETDCFDCGFDKTVTIKYCPLCECEHH